MNRITPLLTGLALILSPALPVQAAIAPQSVEVNDRNIFLVPPEGTCVYDATRPTDAAIINFLERSMQNYSQVLMAFADCKDIEVVRSGKMQAIGDYGQVLFPLDEKTLANNSPDEFISKVTEYYKTHVGVFEEGSSKAKDTLKAFLADSAKNNITRPLGMIHSAPDLVQLAVLQSMQTLGKPLYVVQVITSSKITVPININMYHTADETNIAKVLHDLSARSISYAHTLVELNPENPEPGFDLRDETIIRVGAVVGGIALLAGLWFLLFKPRKKPQ